MRFEWKTNNDSIIGGSITKAKISKDEKVTLEGFFNNDEYKNIRENEMFHLSEDKINKPVVKEFDENREYEIELQLNPDLVQEYNMKDMASDEIMECIDNNDKLQQQHSWYVLNVKQEEELPEFMKNMGSIKTGFSTAWNTELK